MTAFQAFHDALTLEFGEEAALARHELFFHAATLSGWRPKWAQGLRAVAAAIRDLWWLYGAVGPRRALRDGELIRVATLPGASGWGTLARAAAVPAVAPTNALLHPRMGRRLKDGAPVAWLLRPQLSALAARPSLNRPLNQVLNRALNPAARLSRPTERVPISGLAVAATVWRRGLWRSAWRRSLAPKPGALILHNDFDMMSAAAVGLGWPTVCLQHGVPTDEFFPARADWQVVWGVTSEQAYRAAGVPADRVIVDALGRGAGAAEPTDQPPSGLALLSQTHATILGPAARRALIDFVDAAARSPGARVLLHPQEAKSRIPYRRRAGVSIETPPHRLLTLGGEAGALVIGLCSSAMLDALLAGQLVAGLRYPSSPESASENQAARIVAAAPDSVADAGAAQALLERLRSDAHFRGAFRARLSQWRRDCFSEPTEGLARLLARIAS